MATPPHLPPIQAFDPLPDAGALPPPPFPTHDNSMSESPNNASAMDLSRSTMIAPPPTAASVFRELLDGAADQTGAQPVAPPQAQAQAENPDGDDDDSGGEGEEDDDESDDEDDGDQEAPSHWYPIAEDKSVPCEDEVKFIESKAEHSALDYKHWAKETFFTLDDPELVPGESGRIDWLVEHFNGTKEEPNKDLIMRSPIVRIGGYEWQIKFYPQGNGTDYLSVYLENVSMLSEDFKERTEATSPALPVLAGSAKGTKRNSVAAQVSVVMYNPSEPRVYESKTDAHQYHKKAADFGWKYFTRTPRYDFHIRTHGQRQAILRDDKLAFTAYVRIINDPTGCMWDTGLLGTDGSLAATGLRPFDTLSAQISALVPLLHLRPFREFLYRHKNNGPLFIFLQTCLDKLLSRRLKRKHLRYSALPDGCDVVDVLQGISEKLKSECTPAVFSEFQDLFAGFGPRDVSVCAKRLATKNSASIQDAVSRIRGPRASPMVLTLELERQTFNKTKRSWEKVTNDVTLNDRIEHAGVVYSLYAFVKHSGPLGTNNFTPVVRPGGPGTKWYAYESSQVRCMTQKQAMEVQQGRNVSARNGQEYPHYRAPPIEPVDHDAVPYLVMYVREDVSAHAFTLSEEERWDIPDTVRKPRPGPDAKDGKDKSAPQAEDPGKTDTSAANVVDFGVASNGHPPQPSEFQQLMAPSSPGYSAMDGDDVVMSDVEEDGTHTPVHVNTLLGSTTNGLTVEKREYRDLPKAPESIVPITVNFFSGEHYQGFALSGSKKYHGQGHLIHTNGDDYTGTFAHGVPSGKGTMIYAATGNTYTGDWLEGKHHGQGTYTELGTGNVFEGGWSEGRRSGSFVLRGTVTDEDKGRCQICYEKDMTTAFYECGHVLACRECAAQIDNCPVCRKRVLARLELYGVKVSME